MILLITFCIVIIIQLYFYLFLFRKYTRYKPSTNTAPEKGVSIIIAAKNEAAPLPGLLSSLALQEYPLFEIILVDDASSDATRSQMKSFKEQQGNSAFSVKILSVKSEDSKGKKNAVSLGIEAARYEFLLLTDADCSPISPQWIRFMSQSFDEKNDIVLGYGAYDKINNSWLNKLIRFETVLTAVQYFSYALNGKPYMGVGRNLAYKKTLFKRANGFSDHAHIKSGDDDLFISQVANAKNITICDSPASFTSSRPHEKFSQWLRQKRRHITTASHYKKHIKRSLGLFYISQWLFYTLMTIALVSNTYVEIIILLGLLRFISWYSIMYTTCTRLQEKDLWAFGPLYEISIIFIQLYIFFRNIISPPKYW